MDLEQAITTPRRKRGAYQYRAFGELKTLDEWVDDPRCSVRRSTLVLRLRSGMTIEEAILTPKRKGGRPRSR